MAPGKDPQMKRAAALFAALLAASAASIASDPPGRVGRVAHTLGEVVAWLDPDRGWEKAYVNTPITSENSLWTEPEARVELRIGPTAIRLGATTQLDVRQLDDEVLRAHVVRGAAALTLREVERGEGYLVSTPQARFHLLAAGRYRIDADESAAQSRLTVFAGTAELELGGRRFPVGAGEAVRVRPEGGGFDFERAAMTDFDHWTLARDEHIAGRDSSRHVSPRMTGHEDLDRYGSWSTEPDYGAVWYPSGVAVDWAPYRTGHWTWLRPWGWTWIDAAPWGYAPFHYGRWVYVRNRWGWCPGRYVARPVWAPALVGWVGGAGWSVTVGSRHAPVVGWYPLAPWDRYQPWYTNNTTYINNVNVVVVNKPPRGRGPHDRDRDRHYDPDDHRVRGTTVMYRDGFVARKPVSGAMPQIPREVIAAQPVASAATVLPKPTDIPRSPRPAAASSAPVTAGPSAAPSAASAASAPTFREAPRSTEPVARPKPQPQAEPVARPKPQAPAAPVARQQPQPQAPAAGAAPVAREKPAAPASAQPQEAPRSKPVEKPAREAARAKPEPEEKPSSKPGAVPGRP